MVVCRYYNQGYCRYGDRCRFEHPPKGPDNGSGRFGFGGGSAFQAQPQAAAAKPAAAAATTSTFPELLNGIATEMKTWEISKQWPFSCFSPLKGQPCIPGLEDISPEELRAEAYKSKVANAPNTYLQTFATQVEDYRQKREALKNPPAGIRSCLQQMFEASQAAQSTAPSSTFGSSQPSMFGGSAAAPAGAQPATGLFRSFGAAPAGQSVFGGGAAGTASSSTSVFGAQPTAAGSVFGGGAAQQSVFGGGTAQQSVFGGGAAAAGSSGSVFGAQPTAAGSVFGGGSAQQSTFAAGSAQQSVFGAAQQTPSVFGAAAPATSSVFGAAPATSSVFGSAGSAAPAAQPTAATPASVFGAAPAAAPGAFGTAPAPAAPAGAFGTAPAPAAPAGAFGTAPAPAAPAGAFGAPASAGAFGTPAPAAPAGAFGTAPVPAAGAFGAAVSTSAGVLSQTAPGLFSQPTTAATTGLFSAQPAPGGDGAAPATGGLFGKGGALPTAVGGSETLVDPAAYSEASELTEAERKQYEAAEFTLGMVPLKPPTREMCAR